jgi:ketosteroid isomerase-like protein
MKKKNGVNIMLFVFITIFISTLSCTKRTKNPTSGILLKTDREFSAMSAKEGMFNAFLFYIAEDGVILRNNSYPAKGREILKQWYSGKSDTSFILTWEPLFEKLSESGEIGYTYGTHTTTDKLSGKITRGTYVTIWQKQNDGNWRFVLDTGTKGLPGTPDR